jgi:hypothetical protein
MKTILLDESTEGFRQLKFSSEMVWWGVSDKNAKEGADFHSSWSWLGLLAHLTSTIAMHQR